MNTTLTLRRGPRSSAPEWSRRKMFALLIGAGIGAALVLAGLILAVVYAVDPGRHPNGGATPSATGSGASPDASVDPRDLLADTSMPRVDVDASHPGPVSTTDPGTPIALPGSTGTGPAQVRTGFPQTPQGALAQLAAIDQAALQSGTLAGARAVIQGWALPGGPTTSSWSGVQAMAELLDAAGLSGGGSPQLAVVASPLMGQIKGSVGADFVVPCIDFEVDVTLQRTARGGGRLPTDGVDWNEVDGRPRLRAGTGAVGVAGHRHRYQRRLPRPPHGGRPMIGVGMLAADCTHVCPGQRMEAFSVGDLNPLTWLGDAASAAVGDVWLAAMTGLWSAALWLLRLAFTIIDAFTTPDLSASGPIGAVLPTTLWLGATLAVIMMFVQLAVALVRRDGQSMGRVLIGIVQFGAVWIAYLGLAAGFVAAAAGLERGILEQMLQAPDLSHVDLSVNFPDTISDITLATVLGVLGLLIVIPASFVYLLTMFVREAALIILVATAPMSAAGLVSETGKVWFFKSLRWFFSCLLISPMVALVLGVGVRLSDGVISSAAAPPVGGAAAQVAWQAQHLTQQAGTAVVGCLLVAIGACCPMIVFRLLAFVEPGTASGAALRQSWSDAGGMSGVLSGGAQPSGNSAATQSGGDGRSGGESGAESQTQSRLSQAMGALGPVAAAVGTGMQVATSLAHKAADLGSDVLGQAGVGSPGYSMTPTDQRSSRNSSNPRSGGPSGGGVDDPDGDTDAATGGGGVPPGAPPTPPIPDAGGAPGGGSLPGPAGPTGGGAGTGAAGGSEAAAAAVAL